MQIERRRYDADSHVLEPGDWITPYADPALRGRLRDAVDFLDRAKADALVAGRPAGSDKGDRVRTRLGGAGYKAFGAFDSTERSEALDLLGIDAQLVFSTFAPTQFLTSRDLDVVYGGARAHNRALVEFCSADPRLIAVGFVPFHDPQRAGDEVEAALAMGCGSVLVSASARESGRAPSHPDYDGVWGRLNDADVPFMLHIGAAGPLLPRGYVDNGRPRPSDFLGGGENIRSKDYVGISKWPEIMLATLAFDGVFERFSSLRCGCAEQGAEFVVTFLRKLDHAQRMFHKTEPDLAALPQLASDYIRQRVKFTPFPGEDVGWIIDQIGAEMVLFSSDYPHLEGGRDPVAKFEAAMTQVSEADCERFYTGNFAELMGSSFATA